MKRYLAVFMIPLVLGLLRTTEAQDAEPKKQKATSGELYEKIAALDAQVFGAFNARDVDRLMGWFTDDLEFFDDSEEGGPKSYTQVKEDFTSLFKNVPDLHRELVSGTLEVYPLKGYGAIEAGAHQFCHEESGKQDCGVTKFSMVWRKTGKTWKLARVLSYGH